MNEIMSQKIIIALETLCKYKDVCTGEHLEKVRRNGTILVKKLSESAKYHTVLNDAFMRTFEMAALLHDIGKMGIADEILRKPGKLTPEEYETVKKHTVLGGKTIQAIEKQTGVNGLTVMGFEIACFHHERWDGTGYPCGLREEKIPLAAQIIAVADVYDALISKRPYKEPFSFEEAFEIIVEGKGSQFAPDVVCAFEIGFTEIVIEGNENEQSRTKGN